ncbi:Forkhead box protein N4 [Toxocara canis]|uniref:Forkhead box protein N4 n=1 Tax=Toxocara canis TaxID=6265 RepID=A0A0B2V8R1_TOXCA|nr:Forkhead box protein N4 [Toxocara canis]
MLRSSNFGIVYVDGKGSTNTPRRCLSNPETLMSSSSSAVSRTFGSSNIANSANMSSPVGANRRKSLMVKSEDGEEDQPYPLCDDIGDLIADDTDSNLFDGSDANWMHKIDVTQFRDIQQDLFSSECIKEERQFADKHVYGSSPSICENVPTVVAESHRGPSRCGRWMKPSYSYSCLVALALKNSRNGQLTVSEIYDFMCENFPYFRTAPPGWKNSVRHNLSLNKCFQKIELYRPDGQGRKSCLWSLNPAKINKMDQEVRKWRERDIVSIRGSLLCPDDLEAIEQGRKGIPMSSKFSKHGDDFIRANRPICPRPVDYDPLPHTQSAYERLMQPAAKQFKMSTSDGVGIDNERVLQEGSLKASNAPPRRERLRSISVPQGGTLMIPEGSTVREVAAKNLQILLQNHCSRATSYMTPVKNPPQSPSIIAASALEPSTTQSSEPTIFPPINQCLSPTFAFNSPKDEFMEKEGWHKSVLLSPLSTSPVNYGVGTCPYDTVTSALNNNSLLRSALEQSPCRSLTFTAL